MNEFIPTRETVERIKDVICKEIDGCVFDRNVADALGIDYGRLRIIIYKNITPVKEIAQFCNTRNLIINDFLFDNSKSHFQIPKFTS